MVISGTRARKQSGGIEKNTKLDVDVIEGCNFCFIKNKQESTQINKISGFCMN